MRLFILAIAVLVAAPAFAEDVDTVWVRSYDGPANGREWANAIAVDDFGNVYVTGESGSGNQNYTDYATIKYRPDGDTAWVRRYDGAADGQEKARAIAIDGAGNVYVTGLSYDCCATIKYYPNGDTAWVRRYAQSSAYDLAVDDAGNTYITGFCSDNGAGLDYATIKYLPNGDTAWVRKYDHDAEDWARGIAIDDSGNVYVTGRSWNSTSAEDYATIKYDPEGNELWVRRYNGPGNREDHAVAIAVDPFGNIYVTGDSEDVGENDDFATIKYYPNGDTAWVRRYDGPANDDDAPGAIVVDDWGNTYVTGGSDGSTTWNSDYATIKYYPDGDTAWVRRYNGLGNDDYARAIAVDRQGNVCITGLSKGDAISYDCLPDYATVKYNSLGHELWVQRYDGPANCADEATAIAIDDFGDVYVTGASVDTVLPWEFLYDYVTIKYHSSLPPEILTTSPTQHQLNVPVSANIAVTFNTAMDVSTLHDTNFVVHGRSTGLHRGTVDYDYPTHTAALLPNFDFAVGEAVTVTMTTDIQSTDHTPLENGYTWSFTTETSDSDAGYLPHSVYPVGFQPSGVCAADIDNDGDLDLATSNNNSANISVLLNNGHGSFITRSDYPVGNYPQSVVATDLDGDGDLELVTPNAWDEDISVLVNNGDGTFAPRTDYPVNGHPNSVFAADLDNDGDVDLASANYRDVSVLLNKGDGTFADHSSYSVGECSIEIIAADLDGDGDFELVTANYEDDIVSVLTNHGNAIFAPYVAWPAGSSPISVVSGDLDCDGDLELAIANHEIDSISILWNNGDGSFSAPSFYPVGDGPYSVFAADLDGDGTLDLSIANANAHSVSVLLGNGTGDFAAQSQHPVGEGPHSIVAADLDGNYVLDLVTADFMSDQVSVLLNQPGCNCLSIGDCDNDGQLNPVDVVFLIAFAFRGGTPPPSDADCPVINRGDWDCNGQVNLSDVVKMINYVYRYPAPGPCDPCVP